MKLYSNEEKTFSDSEIKELKNIFKILAITLKACLTHEQLVIETEKRKEVQKALERSERKYQWWLKICLKESL
ncbi:MAG: hypothetical protein HC803_05270 [Saprospiraceae bacterium]|nr:hypothetical protein [Saprospiraceae bacterium]